MKPREILFFAAVAAAVWAVTPVRAAETGSRASAGDVRLAQLFGDDDDYDNYSPRSYRTFVDDLGRRITVDGRGRVIAVEPATRRERRQRFDERAIVRGTPPPGAVLEGRVQNVPANDRYLPIGPDGRPMSADPYRSGSPTGQSEREAALPQDDWNLPPPGESIVEPRAGSQPERNAAEPNPAPTVEGPKGKGAKAQVAALQVILDREGMSPGVIDGRMGGNVNKAMAAFQEKFGRTIDPRDPKALAEELDQTGGPAVSSYTLTAEDVAGPYLASIPEDYGQKAKLPAMSYTRPSEMLAERFHMDEDYLKEINPGADFNRPGTIIKVMNVGANVTEPVTRIIADKGREQVRAYDAAGTLVAAYPSTIGSSDTPSPSGTVEVSRVALNPNYTYNPKINFKQGSNDGVLTIPPGPNGPVGSVWIALSKPTYGIHGTPEPSKIGKTNSHGCVRLTNFDAQELAKLVKPGVTVEFID
ncbi:L,D-transpeptidase family protein [Mangrovibrevibacter kandeliae]|uniref:L,D-transpeptidase family protein n=1 Tax=Mangrovibrevibacter kandeliae TaxID=2968473 RepID=UPI0021192432|nr:L,D-transpeptidase [Aurantimonas sp. CSK15Z-1]MCQ8783913.1 L,D-transpeptidase [Aurantimonas sp. CSK15Z-1]